MTTITDYTSLQTAITTFTRRDDIATDDDTLIQLAENELNTELRLSQMMTTVTVSTTQGQNYTSLPTGFLSLVSTDPPSMVYTDNSNTPVLKNIGSIMDDQSLGIISRPLSYAISEAFLWDRLPDAVYTLNCRYFKKWDIANNTTNWLITNHPMLYLAYSMKWAAFLHKNQVWLSMWEAKCMGLLKSVKENDIRARSKASMRVDDGLGPSYVFDIRTGLA